MGPASSRSAEALQEAATRSSMPATSALLVPQTLARLGAVVAVRGKRRPRAVVGSTAGGGGRRRGRVATSTRLHQIEHLDLDPGAAGFAAVIYGHSTRPPPIPRRRALPRSGQCRAAAVQFARHTGPVAPRRRSLEPEFVSLDTAARRVRAVVPGLLSLGHDWRDARGPEFHVPFTALKLHPSLLRG